MSDDAAFCRPYTEALEIIGRRWTGAVLRAMLAGRSRFSELSRSIPGISDRLLSQRLKELEAEGLAVREVTPSTPVCVRYHPTEKGRSLLPVLDAVESWAETWMPARSRG
jgi:DNA-binding HxlR family transcriptional regulator